ncbi:MAG TPA: AI-2E family transporter [Candidatus Obscuribacterales bacterium]
MQLGQWIGLGSLAVSLYILWQIREVLLLVFAAAILATALNQIVRLLQRFGAKRGIGVALSVATLIAVIACFALLIVPPVSKQLQELIDLVPEGLERLRTWSEALQTIIPNQLLEDIRSLKLLTQNFQKVAPRLFGNFFSIFSNSLAIVLNLLLVLVLSIMLLTNPSPYRQGFIKLFPSFYRRRVDEILSECESSLIAWVKATLFNMTIIGLVSGIGLWILQVPLPLTNGLLAGLLEFIPNLGPILSVIPPMLLALLDAPWKAGAVLVLYLLIQQFEGNILVPIVMQKQVSLLPAVTLVSVVIFSIFFGFLGLLLSLPLTIVSQIWIKEVLVKDVLNKWQGDEKDNPQQDSITAENAEANS